MGATAPSRLLPASRDSIQALAVVQETPLAPCLFAAGFCWKIIKKLFELLAAVCGTLAIGCKFYYLLWLFLKWCFLTAELCKQSDYNGTRPSHDVLGSELTKEPVSHVSCEIFVYSGVGWVWSGSIQLRAAQLIIRQ